MQSVLQHLRIRNFTIIEALEVEFDRGLHIISGETGAGKSIVVDALELILGSRGDPALIRQGAKEAEIEAVFSLDDHTDIKERLNQAGIEADDQLIVRRVLSSQGRNRAYINGQLVTLTQVGQMTAELLDISSQHAYHRLADPATHLAFLDAFSGLAAEREQMKRAYLETKAKLEAWQEAEARQRERGEREELIRFQWQELEEVAPLDGEEERLLEQRSRLRHGELLLRAAGETEVALYSAEGSIDEQLGSMLKKLEEAEQHDTSLTPPRKLLEQAQAELREAARVLGTYSQTISFDNQELETIEARLDKLQSLKRKYGGSLEAVLAKHASLKTQIHALESGIDDAGALKKEWQKSLSHALSLAKKLSDKRRQQAKRLSGGITEELKALGMGHALIEIQVQSKDSINETGLDHAEFLIAPNPGEVAKPLNKIASGGELSRSLLAIKRVLARFGSSACLIFDEVDSGVGGAIATAIGQKIAEVAEHHQVLCITHLPQIAAFADKHFIVSKGVAGGRTRSQLKSLDKESDVIEELARMLGGKQIGNAARSAAKDMLTEARGLRQALGKELGQAVNNRNRHGVTTAPAQSRRRSRHTAHSA